MDQSGAVAGESQPGHHPDARGTGTPAQATGLTRKELHKCTSFNQRPAIPQDRIVISDQEKENFLQIVRDHEKSIQ